MTLKTGVMMLKIQRVTEINSILKYIKGLVQPKMKISPCFTHPQAILGVQWHAKVWEPLVESVKM